jgi:hypothetical protein
VSGQNRATSAQVAAVNNQFWYLGFRRADRAERLAACAALLGLDGLSSTKDLTAREAEQLVRMLAQLRARGQLATVLAAAGGALNEPAGVDAGVLAVVLAFALCSGAWPHGPHDGPVSSSRRNHLRQGPAAE